MEGNKSFKMFKTLSPPPEEAGADGAQMAELWSPRLRETSPLSDSGLLPKKTLEYLVKAVPALS